MKGYSDDHHVINGMLVIDDIDDTRSKEFVLYIWVPQSATGLHLPQSWPGKSMNAMSFYIFKASKG